jgi:hypothetical protein
MEQRRTRRFQLQLPLSIIRSGATRVELAGCTNNISSGGVLFSTEAEPDFASPIEYVITLTRDGQQAVSLRCMGRIVRADREEPGRHDASPAYRIAATLERYEFVRER